MGSVCCSETGSDVTLPLSDVRELRAAATVFQRSMLLRGDAAPPVALHWWLSLSLSQFRNGRSERRIGTELRFAIPIFRPILLLIADFAYTFLSLEHCCE